MAALGIVGCVIGAVVVIVAISVWLSVMIFPTPDRLKRKH